ncbi:GNAT family N-acetyltransferase [Limibaculum sp. FT325]|uniref:GNAT family N-acetyltransferase n=1 Tax=Thermohalobaculum sediminis TaxID=2939436 RepID=UPI0020BD85F6|nr:GNAT family N-acetyltransferase [Limibaculum sediminis]MCL5776094.1 GNAT family N-acetyltransferase [Limibaculum sediminis]
MRVEISAGARGWELLADPAFRAAWDRLAAADPKLTLLQERPFVTAWFRAYGAGHEPVMVTARDAAGAPVALMPLARRVRDGRLMHAGGEQAEYHGWIALPEAEAGFLPRALPELARALPFASWAWRWAPPGTPMDWTADPELARAGLHVTVERRMSPVLDLRDGEKMKKLVANKSLRAKMNRYRRAGGYSFERIRDPARTRALMAELARQCDFRQEVINGVRPFADDPCKAAFFVERQAEPEAVHFSVLWNGDRPIAFHFGGCDGRTCLLGLSAFAPDESRNSPGSLLLVELAQALSEAGYERLDLTPGTDPYKQRFATGEQELARLTIHGSRMAALRARAAGRVRHAVQALWAKQDLAVQDRLARWRRGLGAARQALREEGLGALGAAIGGGAGRGCIWLARPAGTPRENPPRGAPPVRRQPWAEMMAAKAQTPASRRRAAMSTALGRFQDGEVLYAAGDGEGPALLAWRADKPGEAAARAMETAGLVPSGCVLIHGIDWCGAEPDGARLQACLAAILADVAEGGERDVALCLGADDRASLAAARRMGFAPIGTPQAG